LRKALDGDQDQKGYASFEKIELVEIIKLVAYCLFWLSKTSENVSRESKNLVEHGVEIDLIKESVKNNISRFGKR